MALQFIIFLHCGVLVPKSLLELWLDSCKDIYSGPRTIIKRSSGMNGYVSTLVQL